jgi:hypothetical protein
MEDDMHSPEFFDAVPGIELYDPLAEFLGGTRSPRSTAARGRSAARSASTSAMSPPPG